MGLGQNDKIKHDVNISCDIQRNHAVRLKVLPPKLDLEILSLQISEWQKCRIFQDSKLNFSPAGQNTSYTPKTKANDQLNTFDS